MAAAGRPETPGATVVGKPSLRPETPSARPETPSKLPVKEKKVEFAKDAKGAMAALTGTAGEENSGAAGAFAALTGARPQAPSDKKGAGLSVKDMINQSIQQNEGKNKDEHKHPLRRIAFSASEEVIVHLGHFSWCSAFFMCFFLLLGSASLVCMFLAYWDTAFDLVSEEISYIDGPNPPGYYPPFGYVKQPNGASSRTIGSPFRFALPQFTIFFSIFSASIGLFTVSYFCSEVLVQDLGIERVKHMGDVINRGVNVFLIYTLPIIIIIMVIAMGTIYFLAGSNFVISMAVGAATCLSCANLGTSMNFAGGPRLTHVLNYDIVASIQMGIRSGAIGGLSAHAMAQLGMVTVWMAVGDANALVGFGTGASIVAFYTRIGGGIFSKGSDIGSDYVSAMVGEDVDDYHMDNMHDLRQMNKLTDQDDDGDVDDQFAARQAVLNPDVVFDENDFGFVTMEENTIRARIEQEMEHTLHKMHPVNYLDAIGENIMDVGGTSSDLFETMCITLATSVILGAKTHDAPEFGTSLPFAIISTGTIGCSLVSFHVWVHPNHESWRIRRSMQLNLFIVMFIVFGTAATVCIVQWRVYRGISEERCVHYLVIILLGLISPELCATICEFFTAVNCPPVANLAHDADLGMIQVVLQGMGQGFLSAGVPSIVNIAVQIVAFRWEGFYGLILLASSSLACTGWQATVAAFGAVANNANRIVHLTTVNEIAHHRANACASIGTQMSHNGKCVAGQNAFFATTGLLGALLADKYTRLGRNYKSSVGQELNEFTRAGLLAGIIFTLLFLSHTLTSCIKMAKQLVNFCKDNPQVLPRHGKIFPATHIVPLKMLVAFSAIESFKLTFAPMCQTFAAPLVIGQLFGFKGLLMLVSGSNSVCFSLNMFLINTGQAWDAARKYILFGMFRDENGELVGPESEVYETLGIGEQIGGPLEDLAGPALNNFVKFVAVVTFVTSDLYDLTPEKSWPWGIGQVILNFMLVSFFRFGLAWTLERVQGFFRRRQEALDQEEGLQLLRQIEEKEREVEERLALEGNHAVADDDALELH